MKKDTSDTRNLLIALLISSIILGLWQYFIELPRKKLLAENLKTQAKIEKVIEIQKDITSGSAIARSRTEWLKESPRLNIKSDYLHGSISLKGLRLDDLTLARYRTTLDPQSPEVVLLSPAYDKSGYFSEIGWLATAGTTITLPDKNTVWTTESKALTPEKPAQLSWRNPEGVNFSVVIALDKKYMFTITQSAKDAEGKAIPLQNYAYINRVYDTSQHISIGILHEGPLAVYDGRLKEVAYTDAAAEKQQHTDVKSGGWVGISDKYWFSAIVPVEKTFSSRIFSYRAEDGRERFQTDYSSTTPQNESTLRLFAGAKELSELDAYAKQYSIPLFDRAVDFGMFYFLTKPIFITLTFFHSLVGNFGIAILLLTILVKLLMYPLASKSFKSMAQMGTLRPKMQEIQERYKDDKQKLNQEMIDLYKREKVNPAAGCLPALLQIPVFFSLYKVLYVTLEMRHAPFFGWIQDLSEADPTNIFTLFGVLQWSPPSLLHLGIWPILMAVTMFIQQSQSPPPPDPTQAKILKFLPLMFLFLFSSVASGLVIYWTWSNVLSILQQWHIKRKHTATVKKV
jgi:YidC/Oxa1 family membrane protein insertase